VSTRERVARAWRWLALSAFLIAQGFGLFLGCSAPQARAEAQNAAIVAGCRTSLELARDAGEAGARDEIARGCEDSLRLWEQAP